MELYRINSSTRLALFVALIVSGTLWLGVILGILPDARKSLREARVRSGQVLANQLVDQFFTETPEPIEPLLLRFQAAHPDLLSIGVTYPNRVDYREEVGDHAGFWKPKWGDRNQIAIVLWKAERPIGELQLRFDAPNGHSFWQKLIEYPVAFVAFSTAFSGLLVWLTLIQKFRYLDPVKVVAGQVRSAFDSLTEGLVLIDRKKHIVHANQAFGQMVNHSPEELVGGSLETFVWTLAPGEELFPWDLAFQNNARVSGKLLQLASGTRAAKYNVNANPIKDNRDVGQVVIVTFDDVTVLEQKKQDLAKTVESLQESRDEVTKQNSHLRFLASRDSLTKCYNRRSFWEVFEKGWQTVPKDELNILIIDIDHFKSINDNFGHSKGDEVLRDVGSMLLDLIGPHGTVCRFGGEEMAILLPNMSLEKAVVVAETVHAGFQTCKLGGLRITASIGMSNRLLGAMDPQHLIDQADQCLYAAKRNGRNQIVRFDRLQETSSPTDNDSRCREDEVWQATLRYSTASALHTALAFRNEQAALHSARLADLCVGAGKSLLEPRLLYLVEVAALTHELGWMGRTETEYDLGQMLQTGEYQEIKRCSCEIVESAFGNKLVPWVIGEPELDSDFRELSEATRRDIIRANHLLAMCDEYLHHWERPSLRRTSAASVLKRWVSLDPEFVERVAKSIDEWIGRSKPFARKPQSGFDPQVADAPLALSAHVHELYRALSKRDLIAMRRVVVKIQEEARQFSCAVTIDAVEKLREAVDKRGVDMEDLAELSDRLLELCRLARKQVTDVDAAPFRSAL